MSSSDWQAPTGGNPLVTVIVPVYNAMPYLTEFLDSLVGQDLDDSAYSVLMVDDGSTDDGPAVMDEYANRYGNFEVLHQENSGWPGTPRNTGLGLARTKYVFFADSDDIVSPSGLRLMVGYAEEHNSDIVIPQLAGMTGRKVPRSTRTEPTLELDLVGAFHTLGPIKLYRRSLLEDHSITFPPEKVRLEDGIFNAHAYLAARRISVLAGEDIYHVRSRDDGQNISVQPLEPFGYTGSVAQMCRIVNSANLDEATRRGIILGLFQRKCLKIYRPGRFIKYKDFRRADWVEAHREFIDEFVTPDMERDLAHPYDVRTRLVRTGDIQGLVRLQQSEAEPTVRAELGSLRSRTDGLELTVNISVEGALGVEQMVCELWSRDGNGHSAFPLRSVDNGSGEYAVSRSFTGMISSDTAAGLVEGIYDLHASRLVGKKHAAGRITVAPGTLLEPSPGLVPYATARGNLSLTKTRIPVVVGSSVPRRLAGLGIRKARSVVARLRRGR